MDEATNNVFLFLKSLGMPGLRFCEGNPQVISVLKDKGFHKTPDLICGPDNLVEAPQEGFFCIDVTQPTGDFLFKENASNIRQIKNNISQQFRSLLGDDNKYSFTSNQLPTQHHYYILEAFNKKLDKYSHERLKTCNTAGEK